MNKKEKRYYSIIEDSHGTGFADWAAAHTPVILGESFLETMVDRSIGWSYAKHLFNYALQSLEQIEN